MELNKKYILNEDIYKTISIFGKNVEDPTARAGDECILIEIIDEETVTIKMTDTGKKIVTSWDKLN